MGAISNIDVPVGGANGHFGHAAQSLEPATRATTLGDVAFGKPRVLLIVNETSVPVGTFGPTLAAAGLELDPWNIFEEPRRALSGYDAVVALGGTMHPDEDAAYPWLAPERAILRDAV